MFRAVKFSIFMYHQVGNFLPMDRHRANYCQVRRFARQMWLLKVLGYEVVSLEQALASLDQDGPFQRPRVVLTFDDGYENFKTQAYPVLSKYGYPSLVYLIAGRLGEQASWFERERRPYPRLLSQDQVLELRKQGVGFGSHGLSHVRLASVEKEQLAVELDQSKKILEELLQEEICHFCYPFGCYDLEVIKVVMKAGYKTAVTCMRGAVTRSFHPLELPRKAVSYGDSLLGFWWKLVFKDRPKTIPLLDSSRI